MRELGIMAHATLTRTSTTIAYTNNKRSIRSISSSSPLPPSSSSSSNLSLNTSLPCHKASFAIQRRNLISLGIASVILGLDLSEKNEAWAATRRPPATPPEERKDPNVSGVQAKVLASKKRKEAMKQAMAKQRERGKQIEQQPNKQVEQQPSKQVEQQPSKQIEQQPSQLNEQPPSQLNEQQ